MWTTQDTDHHTATLEKRRQEIEPIIGRLKQDRSMLRGALKGKPAMRLRVLYAAGYNLCWFLRAILRLGVRPVFFILASLDWLVNVKPHPWLPNCGRFRRRNFPSPTDWAIVFPRQAN
jgi:IS5 family transposase